MFETLQQYFIGLRNVTPQTVIEGGTVDLGRVYRRNCRKNNCGVKVFDATNEDVTLNWDGIYEVKVSLVASATEAGDLTIQLLSNDVAVPTALATETITTPDTEFRTFALQQLILVDSTCVLGCRSTLPVGLSLQVLGTGATISSVVVDIVKVK